MPEALVWYCRRCRKALRSEPKGAVARACRCAVPKIGTTKGSLDKPDAYAGPTKVTW